MQKQENLLKLEYYLEQVENIQKQVQAKDESLQQMIKTGVNHSNYSEAWNLQQEIELMLKQNSQNMQKYISQFSSNIIRISQTQQRQQLMQRCIDGGNKAEKQMKSILKNLQTLSDQIFEQKKKIQVDQKSHISQISNQSSDYFKSEVSGSGGDSEDIQANMQVIDYEQEMVKQRQVELDKIQQLVNNLNSMMIQLFEMIKEQGKCLNLIEENINQMHAQVKGSNYVTNNSSQYSDQLSDQLLSKRDLESNQSETFTTPQKKRNQRNMVVKIPRKPKTKYKCTCGKQYDLNSTLKNHIKQKHNNDKSFQVNKGDRGRPPKQSPVFYQIKDGFVPEIQKLHQIAILILKSNQKFINNINLDNIKNQINSMNQEIDTQVSLIQMDEDAFYWYNQSKSFFDTHFKQLYESFNNSTLNQLLKACYSLSLLKFRNQKEKIIEQFIEKMKEI